MGVRDGLIGQSLVVPGTENAGAALAHLLQTPGRHVAVMLDLIPHLKNDRTLRLARDAVNHLGKNGGHLVLIDAEGALPPALRAVTTVVELAPPDEKALEQVVRGTLRARNEAGRIHVDNDRRGPDTIVRNLRGLTRREARDVIVETVCEDRRFDAHDLNTVLAEKRKRLSAGGLLEFVESPVSLDEVGGLSRLKRWLAVRAAAMDAGAGAAGLVPPRGVLMLGVQGAGKSLAAKAVATAWKLPLLRMDVGALYDKYIGESERNLRQALHQAAAMGPAVLWIDEVENAFASAASHSTDGGLSKRMFGTLLTWMQERAEPVFVLATANDIEALPPELLRKGRFEEIFFVDLPGPAARKAVWTVHLKKRGKDPPRFDVPALAAASDGYSGAEIEQAVIAGTYEAFAAKSDLTTAQLTAALNASPPLSVTMAEKVEALREWAAGRCAPAD